MSESRFQDYESFWPYYISEHRDPRCRWVHFVGTSGFLAILLGQLAAAPMRVGPALVVMIVIGAAFFQLEAKRNAIPVLLAIIGIAAFAAPGILWGVLVAYGCAWVGHFLIEHNRPATFKYPMWSLVSDFRMFGHMLTGRLWNGDGSEIAPLSNA